MDSMDEEAKCWWVICSPKHTKTLKLALEKSSLYDHERKIVHMHGASKSMAIPLKSELKDTLKNNTELKTLLESLSARTEFAFLGNSASNHRTTPQENLKKCLEELFLKRGLKLTDELAKEIPSQWEKHGDFVLLPEKCFTSEEWSLLGDDLWIATVEALGAKRLAKKSTIANNDFRSPQVNLLLGENGWVTHVDNGITYTYDVTKCMFSCGNITEKIRIGNFDCAGQTVVDLYAGIGYFVFPYLVHAGARIVYACEWNPDAVEALKRNLVLNGVEEKCVVLEGDNRKFPHKDVADHVNLGLIPSSEAAWPVACAALNKDVGGWLHVHSNVESHGINSGTINTKKHFPDDCENVVVSCNHKLKQEWNDWGRYVVTEITRLLVVSDSPPNNSRWDVRITHIEHVKSYAPHIDHLVLDVECRPMKTQ